MGVQIPGQPSTPEPLTGRRHVQYLTVVLGVILIAILATFAVTRSYWLGIPAGADVLSFVVLNWGEVAIARREQVLMLKELDQQIAASPHGKKSGKPMT